VEYCLLQFKLVGNKRRDAIHEEFSRRIQNVPMRSEATAEGRLNPHRIFFAEYADPLNYRIEHYDSSVVTQHRRQIGL
jgi:hypothetical protein